MFISVVVCTRDRAEKLPHLFGYFWRLEIPKEVKWELLIVDNGSQDETPEILRQEKARNRLPLVCLEQPVQGKSHALNLALKKVKGDLVVFTDDDMEFVPGWLRAYRDAALMHPDISGFTGKVLPLWEGEIPKWLHTEGKFALPEGLINRRDFGDKAQILPQSIRPGGGNTALRKKALEGMGNFRTDLGPGTSIPYAEDNEYMCRLYKRGEKFFYVPNALAHHRNSTERMTRAYVEKWVFEVARCQALVFRTPSSVASILGIPRYLWRQAFQRFFVWFIELRPQNRFHKKIYWIRTMGGIRGHVDLLKFNKMVNLVSKWL